MESYKVQIPSLPAIKLSKKKKKRGDLHHLIFWQKTIHFMKTTTLKVDLYLLSHLILEVNLMLDYFPLPKNFLFFIFTINVFFDNDKNLFLFLLVI